MESLYVQILDARLDISQMKITLKLHVLFIKEPLYFMTVKSTGAVALEK